MRAAFRKILLFASHIQCDIMVRYGNKVPLDQISAVKLIRLHNACLVAD